MYKEFFGLRANPFNVNPDPRYLFLTRHTEEALACLTYGIQSRKGFVLLTGEVGTGKTTLINKLLEWLRLQQVATAFIFNSRMNVPQFLDYMMADFGIPCDSRSKSQILLRLYNWLLDRYRAGETAVLIVDEAQNLSDEVLEEIRMIVANCAGGTAGTGTETETTAIAAVAATADAPRQDTPPFAGRDQSVCGTEVADCGIEWTADI
jgi:general secretion pathway protein A